MRLTTGIFLICILNLSCNSGRLLTRSQMRAGKCHDSWTYFELKKPLKGIVLAHTKGICGYFMIPWVTVIRTDQGETIRVLEICSRLKLEKYDSVIVNISKDSLFKGASINEEFDCKVKRTCNGLISRIDKK